ncbi:hypothetical protein M758_8G041100 [Ceratodon purpureus]|uniref:Uncharacterized protein n=1 Tax=Ceratodon purpureus TaxID=3225 RepID=A0A8T0H398_CERPU|nr:hypothetical protein KC19_8G042100 [Ceratodon purpureus]KAG0607594.1 hypothetical protein M758_8G041100 [Ceratodon purpureus]
MRITIPSTEPQNNLCECGFKSRENFHLSLYSELRCRSRTGISFMEIGLWSFFIKIRQRITLNLVYSEKSCVSVKPVMITLVRIAQWRINRNIRRAYTEFILQLFVTNRLGHQN